MNLLTRSSFEVICKFHRLRREFPGRWRLGIWLNSKRERLKELPARARKIWRQTYLFIDPKDYYDSNKYLVWGLNPAEPIANVICQLVGEGDCMLDIGANVGIHSALGSVLAGKEGAIYSFEALPDTFERLRVLESRNRFRNIKAWNVAVSDKDGFVDIFPGPPDHTGTTSLRNVDEKGAGGIKVSARRLDSLIDDIPRVKLIKIDVEGAEMLALRGMKDLINRDQPYVLAELTDRYLRELGSSKEEVVGYFKALGYELYRVENTITQYAHTQEFQCDILCVPPGAKPIEWKSNISLPIH